jgi:hypothetical protein
MDVAEGTVGLAFKLTFIRGVGGNSDAQVVPATGLQVSKA